MAAQQRDEGTPWMGTESLSSQISLSNPMGWTEDKNLLDPLNIGEAVGLYIGSPTASRDPVCKWVMDSCCRLHLSTDT